MRNKLKHCCFSFTKMILCIVAFVNTLTAQNPDVNSSQSDLSAVDVIKLKQNDAIYQMWLESLSEPGVKIEGDSMVFSIEARKILSDETYRNNIYKEVYSFYDVKESLVKMDLQRAFWEMINLYPNNKEQVLKYLMAYDKKLPVDEIVTASFYTYAFFDPKISNIINKKFEVHNPIIFEEYLQTTKEIVANIRNIRSITNQTDN